MATFWRLLAWTLILTVSACLALCVAAILGYLASADAMRGASLLALPGMSIIAAPAGLALWPTRHFARNASPRWERVIMAVFGALGPTPLVALVVYDLIWL